MGYGMPVIRRVVAVLVALALVAGACGNGEETAPTSNPSATSTTASSAGSSTSSTDSSTDTSTPVTLPDGVEPPDFEAADPVDIVPTVDADSGAWASIGPEGGVVEATAADGTVYTLTIPGNALVAPESIILKPVTSVDGLPEGTSASGVLLEPEGLVFLEMATLTVSGPAVDGDDRFTAATGPGGSNFHLAAADEGSGVVSFAVPHFSIWLVGSGLETIDEFMQDRHPGDFETWIAYYEPKFRELLLPGSEEEYARFMVEYMGRWLDDLDEFFSLSIDDDRVFDRALAEWVIWHTRVQEFDGYAGGEGGLGRLGVVGAQKVDDALLDAARSAYDRCTSDNDPDQAARLHRFAKVAGLIASVTGFGDGNADAITTFAEACGTFELTLRGDFSGVEEGIINEWLAIADMSPVRLQPSTEGNRSAQAAVTYSQFVGDLEEEYRREGCEFEYESGTAVIELGLKANIMSPQPEIETVFADITWDPPPEEIVDCGPESPLSFWSFWRGAFNDAHAFAAHPDYHQSRPRLLYRLDIVKDGDVYAESRPDVARGNTSIVLRHTPGE